MSKFSTFILLAILLAACGPVTPVLEQPRPTQSLPREPLPTASADWTSIAMTQSGGIMGMMKTIEIASDGTFTLRDERTQTTVTGILSAEQLMNLNELAASASRLSPPHFPSACMDCFNYDIEISASSKSIRLQADDVSLSKSGLAPLVDLLREIMNEAQ